MQETMAISLHKRPAFQTRCRTRVCSTRRRCQVHAGDYGNLFAQAPCFPNTLQGTGVFHQKTVPSPCRRLWQSFCTSALLFKHAAGHGCVPPEDGVQVHAGDYGNGPHCHGGHDEEEPDRHRASGAAEVSAVP